MLGRLAKAGHFGLLENSLDALGINCVLSENCSYTIVEGGKASGSAEFSAYLCFFFMTSINSSTQ